ncbi:hypothetical protein LO772_26890 [Yinghuangia sp. ASG 101]|uniref:hypothetical protein n=1 Tax=Yinghuangia sp. ASG 101 TaxID=2896848 RepID=UPI001E56F018|nr:hypothetical protein [Yinghuangia sp. ASG 101]UGQ10447.1 hypothetical protein LO772_26890 [Yinghuangia sp. ASG 101]
MATAVLEGRPTAFSAARTVRAWDLAADQPAGGDLVFPHPITALAAAPRGRLGVCFGTDIAVLSRHEPPSPPRSTDGPGSAPAAPSSGGAPW